MLKSQALAVCSACVLFLGCKTATSASQALQADTPAVESHLWTSEKGNVLLNGQVFHVKGANWFGLETGGANLLGLQRMALTDMLDWLAKEDFNALRIPLSVEWSLDFDHIPRDQQFSDGDADLRGKPWVMILDKLIAESAKRGIVIMLDMHTIGAGDNLTTKRWYSDRFSICDFRNAWQRILDRYGDRWNIFALDLKNELHDVDWGTAQYDGSKPTVCLGEPGQSPPHNGQRPTDWRQEVESLIPELAIERRSPNGETFTYKGLYLVQGMHHGKIGNQEFPYDIKKPFGFWFGGNLDGLRRYPIRVPEELANRIGYTVHVYGPSVYNQYYFESLNAYNNPAALDVVYESQNGFIEPVTGRALIVGEWGGHNVVLENQADPRSNGKDDAIVLEAIARWFPENCIADAFWWAINPESLDTGGLFEPGYVQPINHKLARARSMMPRPSKLAGTPNSFKFIQPGEFNPKCLTYRSCYEVTKEGTTCSEVELKEGETGCSWGQNWQCKDGCAVWNGKCQ